jgi:hypothetical protein
MIKHAALLTTILLVGCGTVPHVVQEDNSEIITEAPAVGILPPALMMAPPPPPPPPPVVSFTTAQTASIKKVTKHLPKRVAVVAASVAEVAMDAAAAATTSSNVTITEYDAKGNIVKKEEEHHDSFMEFFNKLLDNMTKLIGLGTGALGLWVGFQKLRNPTVKPETA